jgi:high-affinity iron transporter
VTRTRLGTHRRERNSGPLVTHNAAMGNALFIVWRESTEAMLVVGILYAWLAKHPDVRRGMRYLWGGVAAGVGLALALAAVMLGVTQFLSDQGLEYFQLAMMLVASALIVQMVFWMRHHGRTLKRELESDMQENAKAANWWGLLVVVALAVGRESAETVVFLYGLGAQNEGVGRFATVLVLGLGAAFATFWALQKGGKVLSWRVFFRVSEILLLLLAGGLLVSAVDKLIALDVLPPLVDPTWDTSAVLDDSGRVGGLIASLTGYRARPALLPLIALAVYWATVVTFLRRASR